MIDNKLKKIRKKSFTFLTSCRITKHIWQYFSLFIIDSNSFSKNLSYFLKSFRKLSFF